MTLAPASSGVARAVGAREEQAWNDDVLGRLVTRPALALWSYPAYAIVVGRGQTHEVRSDVAPTVRRQTGGGAVLVGPHLLGVSLALPPAHPWAAASPSGAFRRFGAAHAAALASLGVDCRTVVPVAERSRPGLAWACFGGLGPWEVVTPDGRKLVGLAQRRRHTGVLLVSGTLVADPDWAPLCRAFGAPDATAALARATSSVRRALGAAVGVDDVAERVAAAIAVALRDGAPTPDRSPRPRDTRTRTMAGPPTSPGGPEV